MRIVFGKSAVLGNLAWLVRIHDARARRQDEIRHARIARGITEALDELRTGVELADPKIRPGALLLNHAVDHGVGISLLRGLQPFHNRVVGDVERVVTGVGIDRGRQDRPVRNARKARRIDRRLPMLRRDDDER